MKFVNFNKISIQNFLSIGSDPVVIDFKPGIHIITGLNKDKEDRRNGVGKSTIADAIHFAIFGNTIRDLKKENIYNNIVDDTCSVVLEFNITDDDNTNDYKVIRCLQPSKCFFYENGVDITRDSINNTTEYICKLLSTTQDIFQNCVIMTINNTIPFMGKKKVEKRKFIEGIFNLEVFGQMLSSVRQDYNDVKKDFDILSGRHDEVYKTVCENNENKKDYVKRKDKQKQNLIERKDSNAKDIVNLNDKLEQASRIDLSTTQNIIDQIEGHLDTCNDKITDIAGKTSKLETEINHLKQNRKKIGTKNDQCPVCLKSISAHDRDHLESEKVKLKNKADGKQLKIDGFEESLTKLNTLYSELKSGLASQKQLHTNQTLELRESSNNVSRIKQLEEWNKQLDDDIRNIDKETIKFDKSIKLLQQRIKELEEKINGIKHQIEILDVVKFIVSEEGVKSYIVRKILQIFNSKLSTYLRKMDANCCCIFNEYFEEEIVNEKGKMCSYYNFSGAERKNIDLACLFAFMDIRRLQGNVAYNFSVYDELLDTSLDERGVDLVLDLLRERVEKHNECIMIISYRKESVKIASHYKNQGEVIYLEKQNGVTKRVEFAE